MVKPALAAESAFKLDGKIVNNAMIPLGEKYSGPPAVLDIKDRRSYIQPWSRYCPQPSAAKKPFVLNLPCMTANIKYNDFKGMELQGNKWMELACDLATQSVKGGYEPFGSVLLQIDDETGEVLRYWQAVNMVSAANDPTAHAEILAIRAACRDLGVASLGTISKDRAKQPQAGKTSHCELYTSHQSCPMCYSAIRKTGIPSLYFGCTVFDGEVQGLNYVDELSGELALPWRERSKYGLKSFQCTVPNSLDALNLYKLTSP